MKILAVDGPFRGQDIEFPGSMPPLVGDWVAVKRLAEYPKDSVESWQYEVVMAGPHKVCRVKQVDVCFPDKPAAVARDRLESSSDAEMLRPLVEAIRDGRLRISDGSLEWNGEIKCNTITFGWYPPKPE